MAYGASQYRSPVNNNEIVLAVTISGALNELGEKAFSDLLNSLSCISLSGPNYTDFCTVSSKLQKISPQLPVLEYYRAVGKVAKNCKNFLSRAECNTVYIAPMYDIFSNPTFILPIPGSPSTRDGNNPEFSVFWTLRSRESVNMLNALFSNINELLSSYDIIANNEILKKYGKEEFAMNFMQQWRSNCPPLKNGQTFYSFDGHITIPKECISSIKSIGIKQIK